MLSIVEILTLAISGCSLFLLVFVAFKLKQRFSFMDTMFASLRENLQDDLQRKQKKTHDNLEKILIEINDSIALSTLSKEHPIFFGYWSIDSRLGRYLYQHIIYHRPQVIVELGGGSSTALISRIYEVIGYKPHAHYAVDHNAHFLKNTRNYVNNVSSENNVEFLHCPLQKYDGFTQEWYEKGIFDCLSNKKIDLLLIDGPPGPIQENSRYPALPLLFSYLSDNFLVIMDDTGREDEKNILNSWTNEFSDIVIRRFDSSHGFAVIHSRKSSKNYL